VRDDETAFYRRQGQSADVAAEVDTSKPEPQEPRAVRADGGSGGEPGAFVSALQQDGEFVAQVLAL